MQARQRHAARLQEELARNRVESSNRLQLEIKVSARSQMDILHLSLSAPLPTPPSLSLPPSAIARWSGIDSVGKFTRADGNH